MEEFAISFTRVSWQVSMLTCESVSSSLSTNERPALFQTVSTCIRQSADISDSQHTYQTVSRCIRQSVDISVCQQIHQTVSTYVRQSAHMSDSQHVYGTCKAVKREWEGRIRWAESLTLPGSESRWMSQGQSRLSITGRNGSQNKWIPSVCVGKTWSNHRPFGPCLRVGRTFVNSKTTCLQNCDAVPRKARI